jgi:uncharacterized SAM-binding protein YcdF (DUF218 family)
MSAWELTNVTARLLLPPGGLILLGLVGLALVRSHLKAGLGMASVALISLLALSTPVVSRNLLKTLEDPYADPVRERNADAIVVLGGGMYPSAPEFGSPVVTAATLERLRYAAALQRRTGKPILVTGGDPAGYRATEGEQMKAGLKELGATVKWVESASANTYENARLSRKILKQSGVDSIFLVTHAWHMPRAKMAFQNAGLRVVPAPTAFRVAPPRFSVLDCVPSAEGLQQSWYFFHEIAGIAWYRLKFARAR